MLRIPFALNMLIDYRTHSPMFRIISINMIATIDVNLNPFGTASTHSVEFHIEDLL